MTDLNNNSFFSSEPEIDITSYSSRFGVESENIKTGEMQSNHFNLWRLIKLGQMPVYEAILEHLTDAELEAEQDNPGKMIFPKRSITISSIQHLSLAEQVLLIETVAIEKEKMHRQARSNASVSECLNKA